MFPQLVFALFLIVPVFCTGSAAEPHKGDFASCIKIPNIKLTISTNNDGVLAYLGDDTDPDITNDAMPSDGYCDKASSFYTFRMNNIAAFQDPANRANMYLIDQQRYIGALEANGEIDYNCNNVLASGASIVVTATGFISTSTDLQWLNIANGICSPAVTMNTQFTLPSAAVGYQLNLKYMPTDPTHYTQKAIVFKKYGP